MVIVVTKFRSSLRKIQPLQHTLASARRKCMRFVSDQASGVRGFLEEVHTYTELVDGFRNIIDKQRHAVERIFWFFLTWGFVYGTFYTCSVQWNRYVAHPTVISVDRDYRSWNGTLPAVTLCYSGKVDEDKAQAYIFNTWNVSASDGEYPFFREFVEVVSKATVNDLEDLTEYEDDERLEDTDFRQLAIAVHPDTTHTITSFDDDVRIERRMVFTELGLCDVINAPIAVLLQEPNKNVSEIGESLTCNYQKNQCFLKVDIMHAAASVMVHSPFEVPAYDKKIHFIRTADETTRIYKIIETVSTDAVKYLSVDQRKCIFHDEMIGKHGILTGSMCILNCRADTAVELCGCKPFFYTFYDGPECTLSGLICLQRSFWPMQALRVCDCIKSCTELAFLENSLIQRKWSVGDTHFMLKSSLRLEILPQKNRLKRDILFSFEDFLVSFGGAVSLFLGCSIWKVIRLGYILMVKCGRLIEYLRQQFANTCC